MCEKETKKEKRENENESDTGVSMCDISGVCVPYYAMEYFLTGLQIFER